MRPAPARSSRPSGVRAQLHRSERGQASVELVAAIPLVVAVALAVAQLLAAGVARELAGQAAQAGAMAIVQGDGDARAAVRRALPDWSKDRTRVRVDGHHVEVELRPVALLPGLAGTLTARRSADAGPSPEAAVAGGPRG
ncbi:hypothetical protein [Conexibacter sp. SYSU D00693]|uniref:hypothetical protein n=1 Tax=Conexibacter sp. SYSU D00693 TaxID=2812560 RepID=UPI00196B01B6|nr:hypothetical protein [Conexibacter sp. SYSU D00693]